MFLEGKDPKAALGRGDAAATDAIDDYNCRIGA